MLWPLLVSACLALPAPTVAFAPSSERRAAKAAKQAEELWSEGHYAGASELLGKAYELDPQPAYLYARASVEKDAGNCEATVKLFTQFLGTVPPEQDAAAAREAMAPCQDQLEDEDAAVAAAAEQQRQEKERQEQEQREKERLEQERLEQERQEKERLEQARRDDLRLRKDVLGAVLVGSGGAVTAVGIGLVVGGVVVHGNAENAETADEFVTRQQRGRTMAGVGIAVLVTGVALAAGGAVRYGLLARKKKRSDVAAVPTRWAPSLGAGGMVVRF